MRQLTPQICALWNLTPGTMLGNRASTTWAAERDGRPVVVKYFPLDVHPDWGYPLRVAAALRERGWPTPEPVEEPVVGEDGVWMMFGRLPGQARESSGAAEQRARGRLLAELHLAAEATGMTGQRGGWMDAAERVADPQLDQRLRQYEQRVPAEGRVLREARDAAAEWFEANPTLTAPRSVIHGDFAPWNLLYDGEKLTGVLDFEASHHTFQVADFALSWRGYQDEVLGGYDEVRPLSDEEWELIRPVFYSWLFIGVTQLPETLDLSWSVSRLRKHSPLLAEKTGIAHPKL